MGEWVGGMQVGVGKGEGQEVWTCCYRSGCELELEVFHVLPWQPITF